MRKCLFTLLVFLTMTSCYHPERNCADFKTGEFSFDYIVNGEEKTGKFSRNEKFSVEYYDQKIDSSTVKWLNECEFVLQDIKTKSSVHMKIMSTTADSYTFEYSLVGETKKIQGTAIKTN